MLENFLEFHNGRWFLLGVPFRFFHHLHAIAGIVKPLKDLPAHHYHCASFEVTHEDVSVVLVKEEQKRLPLMSVEFHLLL